MAVSSSSEDKSIKVEMVDPEQHTSAWHFAEERRLKIQILDMEQEVSKVKALAQLHSAKGKQHWQKENMKVLKMNPTDHADLVVGVGDDAPLRGCHFCQACHNLNVLKWKTPGVPHTCTRKRKRKEVEKKKGEEKEEAEQEESRNGKGAEKKKGEEKEGAEQENEGAKI